MMLGTRLGMVGASDRVRLGDSNWVKVGASDGIRVGASDWAGHPWLGGGAMSPSPRLVTAHKGRSWTEC